MVERGLTGFSGLNRHVRTLRICVTSLLIITTLFIAIILLTIKFILVAMNLGCDLQLYNGGERVDRVFWAEQTC